MKWWCALIQRWLPEYLDGDLNAFWSRGLEAHLHTCPQCRQEMSEIEQVVSTLKSQPVPDPGPAFWTDFSRELHLRLAQANQAPARRGGAQKKPYYLIAAPALAVLLLWAAGYLGQVASPPAVPPGPALVHLAPPAHRSPAALHPAVPEQLVYAGLEDGLWQEEGFPSWDVNAVLVDLSPREREIVIKKIGY